MHIYVHVPFCLKKCPYCDFASRGLDEFAGGAPFKEYFRALAREIETRAPVLGGAPARTIYFGGGTPGAGGVENLISVLVLLKEKFPPAPECEVTVETNPKALSAVDYRRLAESGFNRVSIGVQSLDGETLKLLGRVHNAEEALEAAREARQAGFGNVSIDLMIGVPRERGRKAPREDLSGIGAFGADHVSVYQFSVCEGTPIAGLVARGELIPLDDAEMADGYLAACSALEAAGFRQYEISNFARNEAFISRHNYSYWRREDYAGFGAGAVSTAGNVRRTNFIEVFDYIAGCDSGDYFDTETLGPAEKRLEKIMLALRTVDGLRDSEFEKFSALRQAPGIRRLVGEGHALLERGRFSLTPSGFMLMNGIALMVADIFEAA